MNKEKSALETLKKSSEDEKRMIMAKQAEKRRSDDTPLAIKLKEFTHAQIVALESFKDFCAQKGIEPTKRQAGKLKEEFIQWLNKE